MFDVAVTVAEPGDYPAIAKICVDEYRRAGLACADNRYDRFLADVLGRANVAHTRVLVAKAGTTTVGTLTLCSFGSPLTTVCVAREAEPRAIAVAHEYQGRGIARALLTSSALLALADGNEALTACVADGNERSDAMFETLDFVRQPERDWITPDGTALRTYRRLIPAAPYCPRCGTPTVFETHPSCGAALMLEPPRFCPHCRRRLRVQVTPAGYTASCSRHQNIVIR